MNHALKRLQAALAGEPDPGREPSPPEIKIGDVRRRLHELGKLAGLSPDEVDRELAKETPKETPPE